MASPPDERYAARTHVGLVRHINQDAVLAVPGLFVVADGMGGHRGGEVASALTIEVLHEMSPADQQELVDGIAAANWAVLERGDSDPELLGMGTTVVAVVPLGADSFALANVGDSRAYRLRDGELHQLTVDHNRVAELVELGLITEEEAKVHPDRNVITRALGVEDGVEVDSWTVDLAPDDRLLLCSDGLVNEVTDSAIEAVLRQLDDPHQAADELMRLALENGGRDNITIVVVDGPGELTRPDVVAGSSRSVARDVRPGGGARGAQATPASGGRRARPAHRALEARLTVRTVAFALAFVVVIGTATALVGYYARGTYHVGLQGDTVTIFKGRPEAVLWFDPTVSERSVLTRDQLTALEITELEEGYQTASLTEARDYVVGLEAAVLERQPSTTTENPLYPATGPETIPSTSAATTTP